MGLFWDHEDRRLVRELISAMSANDTALADLTAAVTALTSAVANAPDDISAGVEDQVSVINAATTSLGGTPPAPDAATAS
jgi:hypothetical protein